MSYRLCPRLSPLSMRMPVSPMSHNLWPSRSRSLVPSLAPSWSSPCRILRLVLTTTSCSALSGRSASTLTGLPLLLLLAIAYSCLLVAPRTRFRRTRYRSSCEMLFLLLGLLDLRCVESGIMTSVVFPPPSPSIETGLSSRFWIQPPGAPVRCSPHSTCATSNTSMMVFCLWVHLWLRARGSGSPHLYLTCSGGGGGPAPSLSALLHGSFTCFSGWMRGLPIQ